MKRSDILVKNKMTLFSHKIDINLDFNDTSNRVFFTFGVAWVNALVHTEVRLQGTSIKIFRNFVWAFIFPFQFL